MLRETLFDSHCHLMDSRFADDREATLERSRASGVSHLVLVGTDIETSRRAVAWAAAHPDCYATVGIAPHEAGKTALTAAEELPAMAQHPQVVALGEMGLEYHYAVAPREAQQALLRRQLQLARQLDLPVVLHHREADADWQRIVEEEGLPEAGGVMHCFTGERELLRGALEKGLYISYAGMVTFKNAQALRDRVRETPLERLLIETDAPYLAPEPNRGKRCEPGMLVETARVIAETLGLGLEDIARITRHNALILFRLPYPDPPEIAYAIGRSLYLNITNRCSNRCLFCVRFQQRELKGHRLHLDQEPNLAEVFQAIEQHRLEEYEEVVFCGYGEPTCRMEMLLEVADSLRQRGVSRIRLNTNGQGNLINQCDITEDLVGRIDSVSVSLNAADPEAYQNLCRSRYGTDSWHAIVQFIQACLTARLDTRITVVEWPSVNLEACERLARQLGVPLRRRRLGGGFPHVL